MAFNASADLDGLSNSSSVPENRANVTKYKYYHEAIDIISQEFGNTSFGPRLANILSTDPHCDSPGCDEPIYARHLCKRCYKTYNRYTHRHETCKNAGCHRRVAYAGRCRRCNNERTDKRRKVPKEKTEEQSAADANKLKRPFSADDGEIARDHPFKKMRSQVIL